jgi:hypothetical protein
VAHEISCKVRNFPLVVVFNGALSYCLVLGYCGFRKVSRNLVDVISNATQTFGYLSFAFASALIVLRM